MALYIEDKPSFAQLHSIQRLADDFPALLQGLLDDGDTAQRATDLVGHAEELMTLVKSVCFNEED